ncbi:MAG: protein-disulfide reductase DsbD family protein [Alphaproteobacteria bacterium]
MKRLYPAVLAALFLCLSLLASSAFAEGVQENAQEERYVKIRLLAERGAVKPGEEIWVALEQSIHPGWHTYWKNPGDSGMAPKIEWSLPAGFEMGPVQWPVPRKLPYGPLLNYGYEGHAILLQKLQVPDEIPSGAFDVGADVEILVCKEECIPEYGTYSLTLNGPEGRAEDNSSYFEKARASLPDQVSWEAAFAEDGESFVLNITPQPDYWEGGYPEELAFIPEEWGVVHNPDKPVLMAKNGYIELRQRRGDRPISAVSAVNGLLTFEDADGRSRGVSFTASPAGGENERLWRTYGGRAFRKKRGN